jgi:hypothetical protein
VTVPVQYLPGLILYKPQYATGDPDEPDTPENVFWIRYPSGALGAPAANLKTLGLAMDALWGAMWKVNGAALYHFVGSIVQDYSSDTGLEATTVGTFGPVAGEVSGFCPDNVAGLISWQGPWPRYKGGHPRTYLPYQATANLSYATEWTSGTVTSMNSAIATFITGVQDYSWNAGAADFVGSPSAYLKRRVVGEAETYQITGGYFSVVPATQRRRLRKVHHK